MVLGGHYIKGYFLLYSLASASKLISRPKPFFFLCVSLFCVLCFFIFTATYIIDPLHVCFNGNVYKKLKGPHNK